MLGYSAVSVRGLSCKGVRSLDAYVSDRILGKDAKRLIGLGDRIGFLCIPF